MPHLSQQNVFLGLPLILLPEEVVLLVEKGKLSSTSYWLAADSCAELAVLIDDPSAHTAPSAKGLSEWNLERESAALHQISVAEAERTSEKAAKLSTSEEAVRKRKEREAKRAAAARAKAIAEGLSVEETTSSPPHTLLEDRSMTPVKTASPTFNVTIPASSSNLAWYDPSESTYASLRAAREAGVWTYPETSFDLAKCRVFRDLWEKGNYMGGGIKFGGDFLVYPGLSSRQSILIPSDHSL